MNSRRVNKNVLEICEDENKVILSIEEKFVDGIMYIKLAGEIKNEVAHEFEDEIMAALSVCGRIRIDFAEVQYIASMALRILLSLQRMIDEMDGAEMTLTHISKPVMAVFQESGFDDILLIEED